MVIDLITGIEYATVGEVPDGNAYWESGIAISNQQYRDFIAQKMFALDAEMPPIETKESVTVDGYLHERVLTSEWVDVIDESHSLKYLKDNTPAYAFPIEHRAFMARSHDYLILISTL